MSDNDSTVGEADERDYSTLEELWQKELKDVDESSGKKIWYKKAEDYWQNVPATVNGVLGGYAYLSSIDLKSSKTFLKGFLQESTRPWVAVDCGAGIGRITKGLLLPLFDKVDMVEVCPKFVQKAQETIKDPKMDRFLCMGLQDFVPDGSRYDVIWSQWVLGHLTDADLIAFFQRCKAGLKAGGHICVKENVCMEEFELDKDDNSITRSEKHLEELFVASGLSIVKKKRQTGFPKEIFPVNMYALQ
eukprot:comp21232_c1_seq1/m.28915 comp21232_c1_seq1/g.28915  ORF comp21232_c1_seq1/g.28915 comp21232_c1_seq1/m.28915 type:complete len:246 (-) comp21232_c1_seq1:302-1039(-)